MADLGLGIVGVVGTVDVCIKWGTLLVKSYKDYQNADPKLNELTLRIEMCWSRLLMQLEVTRELDQTITREQRDLEERALSILQEKLSEAVQKLSKHTKRPGIDIGKKLQFSRLRESLEEAIAELESWQKRYEPPWFSLIKVAPPVVDTLLSNAATARSAAAEPSMVATNFRRAFIEPAGRLPGVFLHEDGFRAYTEEEIPYSTSRLATLPNGFKMLVVDRVHDAGVNPKDVRDLARRLRDADPFTFGILACKGIIRQQQTKNMALLFQVPEGYKSIRSVRDLLLSGQAHDSLSDRLEMAKQLVRAVYYVHLYGFVHKNIHPEIILTLSKTKEEPLPMTICLLGFEVVRNVDGMTYRTARHSWEDRLYRHSGLQRPGDLEYYLMQHDIYSLGVCLLEIGMWKSFVTRADDGTMKPSPMLGLSNDPVQLYNPRKIQERFVALSRSKSLKTKMGTKYSQVVETCLTCLDDDNGDFGDVKEFQDEDGITVGVRYIEKVVSILNNISI